MKKLLLICSFFLLAGCASMAGSVSRENNQQLDREIKLQVIKKCIDLGGIPIYENWDTPAVDCKPMLKF